MADDNLKDQRAAFDFLREKFRTQDAFTKGDLQQKTSWDWKSVTTYWSKQFEPFVKAVPPILKGAAQKDIPRHPSVLAIWHLDEVSPPRQPKATLDV